MLNYLITFNMHGKEDSIRAGAVFQNLEWIKNFHQSKRVEFLYGEENDEDGIIVKIMLVNIDEYINIKEFVDNKMNTFFEHWDFEISSDDSRQNISDYICSISYINDLQVYDNYVKYVKEKFDFLEYYDYNMTTSCISDDQKEKEMIDLIKTVYYDFGMEWLLLKDNQDYFEQKKEKYFGLQKKSSDDIHKFAAKAKILGIQNIYRENGDSIIYGKYHKIALIHRGINNIEIYKPSKVNTEIADFVFDGCTNIETAKISGGINKFGSFAFRDCSALTDITIGTDYVPDNTFLNCINLKKINFEGDLYKIEDHAFNNCASLKEIELPNTLKEIGHASFINCKSLSNINFPPSLQKIGDYAFKNCPNIESVEIPKHTIISENSFNSNVKITRI